MRLLVSIPFLVLLIAFALSNTQTVRLGLWPTDLSADVPLSIAVLVAMGIAFFIGGLLVWLQALAQRRRARRAEEAVRRLEAQLAALRSRLPTPLP